MNSEDVQLCITCGDPVPENYQLDVWCSGECLREFEKRAERARGGAR